MLRFATERAGELFRLTEDLNGEILNLEPVTLLNETKVMLEETKAKYLKYIEGYFEVTILLENVLNLLGVTEVAKLAKADSYSTAVWIP